MQSGQLDCQGAQKLCKAKRVTPIPHSIPAIACPSASACGRLNRTNQPTLAAAGLPTSWLGYWGICVMKRQHTLKKLAELKKKP